MNITTVKRVGPRFIHNVFFSAVAVGVAAFLSNAIAADPVEADSAIQAIRQRFQSEPVPHLETRIAAFADTSITNVNGRMIPRSTLAQRQVVSYGRASLPFLISATEHTNVQVRVTSLQAMQVVGEREQVLFDLLPVFVGALRDTSQGARLAAVAAIGVTCAHLQARMRIAELQTAVAGLVTAMKDSEEDVRLAAALYLMKCNQAASIPANIRQQIQERKIEPGSL